tara:strand:+ start:671 stop:1456 length:786 start_codon:yes stop_codon:yes gene_type:complete
MIKKIKQKKLVFAIPCRNTGKRLFGKPVQFIDPARKVTVLEQLVRCIKKVNSVSDIVLGISYGNENKIFEKIAKKNSIKFIYGKEYSPLERVIQCAKKAKATDVLRITSECPFPYYELIDKYWNMHKKTKADGTFLENIIDGCGFEIISLPSLIKSQKKSRAKRHLEDLTYYIRKNYKKFKINKFFGPKELNRKDLRLTVDYPEDLALCRKVYKKFINQAPMFKIKSIVKFLDKNPALKKMIRPYVRAGYTSMYKWGKRMY